MKLFLVWFLLLPTIASAAADKCTTATVLMQIRPGAAWSMQGDSMQGLKWLDKKQGKPSNSEVLKAKQLCLADTQTREAKKAQARLELKLSTTPTDKKVEDLILLSDLDR